MSCDNSISSKTILLIIILVILIYIILYKIKENKKENLENNNLTNLQNNLIKQYNYNVESWVKYDDNSRSGSGWGKDTNITIISNHATNTLTLFKLKPLQIDIYILNENKVYYINPLDIIKIEKNILDNDLYDSKINIRDQTDNILLTIDKYPQLDGIKLKNDLINSNLFTVGNQDIDPYLLQASSEASSQISFQKKSPFEIIFIDDKATIEPNLFNAHKKCLNNKADSIQTSLTEFATYTKDFVKKNGDMTPDKFILNENTRDKIRNIIKKLKNITESEFDCLYVNEDAPFKVCDSMRKLDEYQSNNIIETLNQLMMAEKFIILYHNEIIDLKRIVIPKLIHFITICNKIKKEDKQNLLILLKKNINIVNYIAYIIGGNNNLIKQINSSLKSIS